MNSRKGKTKQAISQYATPPRIESLQVRNFRALREVEFTGLTPLIGLNGSGKSTVFDAFTFLAECFEAALRRAWDRRGRARELKTRGAGEAVTIEIKYRERPGTPLMTYHLDVDEVDGGPVVVREWLAWKRDRYGAPFQFVTYWKGEGWAVSGEAPDVEDDRVSIPLKSPDLLAVNALGQFHEHPRVAALRDFIMDWHVSCLSAKSARGQPDAGPHERLTRTGDNLANVIQYLGERHPSRLERIFDVLRKRVPRLERLLTETMPDGRLYTPDQGRPVHATGAGSFRLRRHVGDAGLSGVAVRPRTTSLHRNRGARELSAPAAALRIGRGVPRGQRAHAIARDYSFTVLSRRVAA